jgi:hypothetical protein
MSWDVTELGQHGAQHRQEQYTAFAALRLDMAPHWPQTVTPTGVSLPGTQQSFPLFCWSVASADWQFPGM